MSRRAHLVFLLHMHQPDYRSPLSGRAQLPWVRLHGARGYLDVGRMLEQHQGVRLTVNFVPSLLEQLAGVADGAVDEWLALALKPTAELTLAERASLLERYFSVNWSRSVEPRPRYRELLEKRGREVRGVELAGRAAAFSDAELRDLTVLFHLAWLGFAVRHSAPEVGELEAKGRNYSLADLEHIVGLERAAGAEVIPLYRRLAERGQIELAASPYYHPIVPLLVDSDAARRALPAVTLPERFAWPEDAALQIRLGLESHARSFGRLPAGMWPPEGCISPEAVASYAAHGVRWLGSDEGNLWRSLELGGAVPHGRGDLYRVYRHAGVDLLFRNLELSNRISFAYARGDAETGVADLLAQVRAAAALATGPSGDPVPVPIFLDGENPWESYPDSGEPFLRLLFQQLETQPDLGAASVEQHLGEAAGRVELARLHSGSWIDSDFHIWIGDPVKNRAWDLLSHARRRFEKSRLESATSPNVASPTSPPVDLERARQHLLAAEGSDWFWWFGEPFHSIEDPIFDRLFRDHLAGAWRALGEAPPDELQRPVSETGAPAVAEPPTALIRPRIGVPGRSTGFYEWYGAGRYPVPRGAAMAEAPLVDVIRYGFDRTQLYLRLEPAPGRGAELKRLTLAVDLRAGERRLRLDASPAGWRVAELDADGVQARAPAAPAAANDLGAPVAFAGTIEVAVPFERLGLKPGERVQMSLRLYQDELVRGDFPSGAPLGFTVPDDAFEADNWSA